MSDDDEKMTWRSWAFGLCALAVATMIVTGLIHLRVLSLGVDSVPGFAVRGEDVVVFERIFNGEETPAGGDRLVRLDVRSGEVKRRVRADDSEWVREVAGLVWFMVHDGLEARDFESLRAEHRREGPGAEVPRTRRALRPEPSSRPAHSRDSLHHPRRFLKTSSSSMASSCSETGIGSSRSTPRAAY